MPGMACRSGCAGGEDGGRAEGIEEGLRDGADMTHRYGQGIRVEVAAGLPTRLWWRERE